MGEELFSSPPVLRVIRAVLRSGGIRDEHDLDEGVHDVVLECLVYVRGTGRPPEDMGQASSIARRIAIRRGSDEVRRRSRRGKVNAGPTGDADAHAQEPAPALDGVDRERLMATLKQSLTDEEIEALADLAAKVQYAELAADGSQSEAAIRKSAQRSREKALGALGRRGYVLVGGFAALLGATAIYVWDHHDSGTVAHGNPYTPAEIAAEHRRVAADACEAQRWNTCAGELDEAAEVDPGSERRVEVKALRAAIAEARRGPEGGDARAGEGGAPAGGR